MAMAMFHPPHGGAPRRRSSAASPSAFCVVSYNILSSHLAQPDHFRACKPADLDQNTRLQRVKQKLKPEMQKGAIICLQEVSTKWAGPLHVFMQENGYHFVTGLYGKQFNGYMGVAMAWPINKFEAVNVDITRLSDICKWGKPPKLTTIQWIWESLRGILTYPLRLIGLFPQKQLDPYQEAKSRMNILLFARLKSIATGRVFCVGTYHMPCMFYLPSVMVIHTALASQRINYLAGRDPHVLAGDFNFKPDTSMYNLITEAKLDKTNPDCPPPLENDSWIPKVPQPMRSAYKDANQQEPDFTNYAKVKDDEPFIDTLDYIFYSPDLKVVSTMPLPNRTEMGGPLPTSKEPSDHIMVAATFDFKKK